jgi:hypothetical protein
VIDGTTYQLPNPGQPAIAIMLVDGSMAQLLAGKVILRGQTLHIPSDLSIAHPISAGGQSITVQPGKSKKPDQGSIGGGNTGGGSGPFSFLKGITNAAGSVAKAVGGAASSAASFASGAAGSGGTAVGNLASTFSSAVDSASEVVSTLNGIQQAFPVEGLSKTGMDVF